MIFAIKTRYGNWRIVQKTKAATYGEPRSNGANIPAETEVWSEVGTTAWVCLVGQEEKCVVLEEPA